MHLSLPSVRLYFLIKYIMIVFFYIYSICNSFHHEARQLIVKLLICVDSQENQSLTEVSHYNKELKKKNSSVAVSKRVG